MKRMALYIAACSLPMLVTTALASPAANADDVSPSLSNYQIVTSPDTDNAPGQQNTEYVSCPSLSKAIGGGGVILNNDLQQNLSSSVSAPSGRTWRVDASNTGTSGGTFRVYAVCAGKAANYTFAFGDPVEVQAGQQAVSNATCPSGRVPLGGGGNTSSLDPAVNINSSFPTATGWRVYMNNASATDTGIRAYAICAKQPPGYVQVAGTVQRLRPGQQGFSEAVCPTGTVVFSGGGYSTSTSTAVNLNSTYPNGSGAWRSFESNASSVASKLTAYAVCGKVFG